MGKAFEVWVREKLVGELRIRCAVVNLPRLHLPAAVRVSARNGGIRLLCTAVVEPLVADAYALRALHHQRGSSIRNLLPVGSVTGTAAEEDDNAAAGVKDGNGESEGRMSVAERRE